MENKYSKKQLEELYCCGIFKDFGFDDSHQFYVANGLAMSEDESPLFDYADGWTLDELHENIRNAVFENIKQEQSLSSEFTLEEIKTLIHIYKRYCDERNIPFVSDSSIIHKLNELKEEKKNG